jgi:hypothetical protein
MVPSEEVLIHRRIILPEERNNYYAVCVSVVLFIMQMNKLLEMNHPKIANFTNISKCIYF